MKRDINTLSLLNEISELVYVSDPETYELLFVNQTEGIDKIGRAHV